MTSERPVPDKSGRVIAMNDIQDDALTRVLITQTTDAPVRRMLLQPTVINELERHQCRTKI